LVYFFKLLFKSNISLDQPKQRSPRVQIEFRLEAEINSLNPEIHMTSGSSSSSSSSSNSRRRRLVRILNKRVSREEEEEEVVVTKEEEQIQPTKVRDINLQR